MSDSSKIFRFFGRVLKVEVEAKRVNSLVQGSSLSEEPEALFCKGNEKKNA